MIDADLPPLPQLLPVADTAFHMRCMTDDALRELQREAFKAGLQKAIEYHETLARNASGQRVCYVHHDSIKAIRAMQSRPTANGNGAGGQNG